MSTHKMLLHSLIFVSTVPRKCRNQEQNHPLCERMYEVATTGRMMHTFCRKYALPLTKHVTNLPRQDVLSSARSRRTLADILHKNKGGRMSHPHQNSHDLMSQFSVSSKLNQPHRSERK